MELSSDNKLLINKLLGGANQPSIPRSAIINKYKSENLTPTLPLKIS